MTIFNECIEMLREAKLAWDVKYIDTSAMFCHPKNRAGLMLSPHNAHRNGDRIRRVGADLKQLTNAYCIEMQPEGEARNEQVDVNQRLIARSKGLLAPVTSTERYLSLGCGHTAAFCKAARAGCVTPQEKIADENGCLSMTKLCEDKVLKGMIEDGWTWTVIAAKVDVAFPGFSELAQGALNLSNNVASLVSEIEVAKTCADMLMDQCGEANPYFETAVVESIAAGCPPCMAYINHILQFVKAYGGAGDGRGRDQINFLDSVSKQFQCHATLGETFWNTIANTAFASKTTRHPRLRNALILTNLTSPKLEDGIAKLITKTDVNSLCQKASLEKTKVLETRLEQGSSIVEALLAQGKLKPDEELGALGRFHVRLVLHALDKEKHGREQTKYKSVDAICSTLLKDLGELVGQEIKFASWPADTSDTSAPSDAAKPSAAADMRPIALKDNSNPTFLAQEKGFKVDTIVYEKAVGSKPDGLYRIESIETEHVVLKAVAIYTNVNVTATVAFETVFDSWAVFKGELPVAHPHSVTSMRGTSQSVKLATDAMSAILFNAIYKLAAEHDSAVSKLLYYRRPDEVRAKEKFERNALVLAPMVPLSNISSKKTASSFSIGEHKVLGEMNEFFAIPLAKPSVKHDEWNGGCRHRAVLVGEHHGR